MNKYDYIKKFHIIYPKYRVAYVEVVTINKKNDKMSNNKPYFVYFGKFLPNSLLLSIFGDITLYTNIPIAAMNNPKVARSNITSIIIRKIVKVLYINFFNNFQR